MGRSMLIIVTSLFLVFSMTQVGVMNRQTQIDRLSVSYANLSQARNAANAGMERALQVLGGNREWRVAANNPVSYNFGNNSATVVVIDRTTDSTIPLEMIEIRSIGTSNGVTARVTARIHQTDGIPPAYGAVGVYGSNVDVKFNGNSFLISGVDRNPPGTVTPLPSPAVNIPGMTTNTLSGYNSVMSALHPTQYTNIQGTGANPSIAHNTNMNDAQLLEFISYTSARSDFNCTQTKNAGSLVCSNQFSPGTPASPKIMVIKAGGHFNLSTGPHAGVIIVEPGGTLELNGNPEYHGLIIGMGTINIASGTPKIFGGIIYTPSPNPSAPQPEFILNEQVEITMNGGVMIQYSSNAIKSLTNMTALSGLVRQNITYILD
jgi:hypothetical protein